MTPPRLWRRCWRADCPNRIELDPLRPDEQRYCSPACVRKDAAEIARTERATRRLLARAQKAGQA